MNYLQKIHAEKENAFDIGLRIGRQQVIDFLQLALQKHGFGEKRMLEVMMDIQALHEEFKPAFNVKYDECDYYRDRLDRALAQSCGEAHPLIPFAERYEDLKQVNYGRRKR